MRPKRAPSDGPPKRHHRLVMLLGVFTLFLSLLTPLITLEEAAAASAAAELAQGVPPDCDPGFVVSDDGQTCVEDTSGQLDQQPPTCPEGQVLDEASGQCVPDQSQQPQTTDSYIQIDKFDCPSGTDFSSGDYGLLSGSCPANQQPVNITVNQETQQVGSGSQWGPFNPGGGNYQISEEVPQGYDQPWVFCGAYIPGQFDPSLNQMGQTSSFGWDLNDNEYLYCQIYNIPTGQQYGSVIVHKFACPESYTFDPYQASIDDLQQSCTTPQQNVSFSYEQNGSQVGSLTTDQSGMAQWDQAPVGDYVLREQIPVDYAYAVVHCSYHEANQGNFVGQSQPMQMLDTSSFGSSEPMAAGYVLDCYWFNIPTEQIQLYKYWCPPDFNLPDSPTQQDFQPCAEQPASQASYRIATTSNNQDVATIQSSSDVPGYAGYHQLQQDQEISIVEELPPDSGYGTPTVFCSEYQRGNPSTPSSSASYDPSTGVTWTPRDGYYLVCFVYNIPTGGNSITIYKWECAPGTEYGRELDYYQGGLPDQDTGPCESEHLNVPISLIDGAPDSPHETTTQANGTQFDNVVLDNGSFQVAITEPDGFGDPMVFCATLDEDTQTMVTATGGQITITPSSEPFTYQCNWYNIPTGFGQVVIEKYWCPPGLAFVQTPTQADMQAACQAEPGTGASFTLEGPSSAPQTWPDQQPQGPSPQSVFWDQLPAGQYTVRETGLDDTWIYTVYCHESNGQANGAEPQMMDLVDGNGVQWDLQGGYTLDCAWFNQPTTNENSITVYKWQCVEGTEYGNDQLYYQGEGQDQAPCETEHLNIPISLIHGGPQQDTTTQANGTQFDNVVLDANGSFQIAITEPSGFGEPMVFCGTLDEDTQTMVPTQGGTWTLTPTGEPFTYQCNVYDVPTQGNSVTVYKWQCEDGTEYGRELDYYQGGLPDQDTGPCESEHLNIPISLIHGGPQQDTTTQANGTQFDNVILDQNGSFQIAITEPADYGDPMVFCATLDEDTQTMVQAPGGTWSITPSGEPFTYQCNVYDIPSTFTTTAGTNWITIYKYLCAPDEANTDLELLRESCTEPQSGVPFSLSGEGMGNPSEQSTSGGSVEWSSLTAGAYTVTEQVPPGYGAPLIWCGYASQNGEDIDEASQQYDAYTATDGGIQLQLDGEYARIVCYWYNFPGTESTVTIYKYVCDYAPAGFQSLDQWQSACPTQGNDYTFTLTDSAATATDMTTSGGNASWSGVPEGDFTLSEQMPPGYGEPVVWCGWTAYYNGAVYDAFPQQVTTSGGIYNGTIPYPGTTYFCYWFNIPSPYSTITVYKYNCPEGYLEGVTDDPLGSYLDMCTTYGNGYDFSLENSDGTSSVTTLGGVAQWSDVPLGDFTLTETVPPGYDPPLWFCGPYGSIEPVDGPTNTYSGSIASHPTDWICYVFDFPDPSRTVVVYKWLCPEGYQGSSYEEWSGNCTMPMDGVSFTFSDINGSWTQPTTGGMATWYGGGQGDVSLDEHIPPGYFEPVFYCSLEAVNGAAFAEDWTQVPSSNGTIQRSLDYSEYHWICNVYNVPKGPGEITVYKWLCPPGYDFYAWGADPAKDCTQAMNGVTFTLDQPVGPNLQTNTGDSVPGAVYFGGLDPGDYVVTETVPADIDYVFVLNCVGSDDDKVNPYPLMWGNTLPIKVAGGDKIVCNWYNVPYPENGWVTLYKYQCWTATFTGAVNCEIYEFGATFELKGSPSGTSYGVGTTNSGGLYTWNNLPEGAYSLDEISHTPCKITATKTDGQGHAKVDAGQGTIIKVYNCKSSSKVTPTPTTPGGTPPKTPGKVPGKFPNTGVDPNATDNFMPPLQAGQGTPTPPVNEAPEDEYYKISCLEGATPTPEASPEATATAEATTTATPEEFDLPLPTEEAPSPTSEASPSSEEPCVRGALPERVVIDAAKVDAGVETLEIIDGVMEQPTGPELVTWYKETGRLGESNNVVIAGHLNYWGVPEGVFFYLSALKEGDRVEITGDDGNVYVYEVQWVRQESNLAPPAAEVIGPTDEPSLTLITCGGEWNAGISEYDERTVARAVQVDVKPATASTGGSS